MKEVVRDLLGVIGRGINFLFPFTLPQRIYRHMGFKGTFVFKIEKDKCNSLLEKMKKEKEALIRNHQEAQQRRVVASTSLMEEFT